MKRLVIAMAAVALLGGGVAATATAAPDGGKIRGGFARMFITENDADGDGKVARAELQARRARLLGEWDSNGDGTLSEAEYAAGVRKEIERRRNTRIAERYAAMDVDGDGQVSTEEFALAGAELFGRLDRDRDGFVEFAGRGGPHRGGKGPHGREDDDRDGDDDGGDR